MNLIGIIGYPLVQSYSQPYFRQKFSTENITDLDYLTFPITNITKLPNLLAQHNNLIGLNVTIPYKVQVLAYVHHQTDAVKQIGAANCLAIHNGVITAYNTDVIGFTNSLKPLLKTQHSHALILGTGGAAKAVAYSLQQLGISYTYVSRSAKVPNSIAYSDVTPILLQQYKLIVNASPSGMVPNEATYPPIPYSALTAQHLLYDLVYKPAETIFLQNGITQGCATKNGYEMLLLQANAGWDIWKTLI